MGLRKRALCARRAPLGTELIYTFRDGLNFGEGLLNIQVATAALRGSLPKSGPLDFATKNTFPLFFVGEEALVGVY